MELKQFVEEALLGITEGVERANSKQNRFRIIGEKRNESGHDGNMVDFDVWIAVDQKTSGSLKGKVGGSVPVLNVVSISAGVDSKLDRVDSRQDVNRLKFKVWVSESNL